VLTGSGLGQQNASTRRCCSPIRSFVPLAGGMEGSVSLACAPGVASVELLGRAPRLRRSGCSTEAASARPSPPGQVEACRLSQPKNMILLSLRSLARNGRP
jgi:hypothetical protein